MFDGVHLGHQFVLRHVVEQAQAMGVPSLCITFDQSPRHEQVLTPLGEKIRLIRETGIDRVEVLPFTDELKAMTAREFMEQVLNEQLGVQVLLTGYDNRFGHNREEGFDDYVRYGRQIGIAVRCLPQAPCDGMSPAVSSSLIRRQLLEGRVGEAAASLGRHYTIAGQVEHGEHIGTGLGFPTANIRPDDACQLIPANGVYAVEADIDGSIFKGMMNIGTRPTFDGQRQTLEVHIFHLHDNLYGRPVRVSFLRRLREEQRFSSAEKLIEQLKKDAILAQQ
jgi:riboflavin kinase/FMN adenylyltransferase